jgi:hypothetical protein
MVKALDRMPSLSAASMSGMLLRTPLTTKGSPSIP